MNRREFLSGSMALLQSAPGQQLNVLLILVDDWGATDLGCGGSKFYETPNMDRLAASGMRFTQAYSACTVCSPTVWLNEKRPSGGISAPFSRSSASSTLCLREAIEPA